MNQKKVIDFICREAKKLKYIEKVYLYGSRARGEAMERSDFDIAVLAPKIPKGVWSKWSLQLRENVPTLCGLDIVRMTSKMSSELKSNILNDGKLIYERKN